MKGLKKLVLASAIIAASSSALAMQAMDDQSMSDTTGQDGLTVNLSTNMTGLTIKWIDRDGITADPAYTHAGGVVISPIGIVSPHTTITIDAGGTAGDTTGNGQLRIGVTMGAAGNAADNTIVNLNNATISVGDAYDKVAGVPPSLATDPTAANVGTTSDIIKFDATAQLTIAAGGTADIRLGSRTATYVAATDTFTGDHLITLNTSIPSLSLTGMAIVDNVGGGQITIGTLVVNNIVAKAGIDAVPNGLRIDTTGTTLGDVGLEQVRLGTAASAPIGDIYVSGLTANNVITITGH
jgi:hypothetical protein